MVYTKNVPPSQIFFTRFLTIFVLMFKYKKCVVWESWKKKKTTCLLLNLRVEKSISNYRSGSNIGLFSNPLVLKLGSKGVNSSKFTFISILCDVFSLFGQIDKIDFLFNYYF